MGDEKNLCSSGWHGDHGTTIRLVNNNKNDVTVNDCGNPSCSWPFSSPPSPFTVPANGYRDATLQNTPGNDYCYCTSACPGEKVFDTNPKTVIIS